MSNWSYSSRVLAITTTCAESGHTLAIFVDHIAVIRPGKSAETARIVMSNSLEYHVEESVQSVIDRISDKATPPAHDGGNGTETTAVSGTDDSASDALI